jgi:hypothetical protein
LIDKIHGYLNSIIKEIQESLAKVILPLLKKGPFCQTEFGKNEVCKIEFGIGFHSDADSETGELRTD